MTVRTLKIGDDGDLVVEAGQLVLLEDGDAILQAVRSELRLFLGEWFLDTSKGFPWFESVLVKNPDLREIRAILRRKIEGVTGVVEVTSLTLDYDSAARSLAVTFSASTDAGELSNITVTVEV